MGDGFLANGAVPRISTLETIYEEERNPGTLFDLNEALAESKTKDADIRAETMRVIF